MSRKVNAIIFGVGGMGKIIARYMEERGINIVGAINRKSNIGEDLGRVIGLDKYLGIKITDNPDTVYEENEVDIAVISTTTEMESLLEIAGPILKQGINVVTLSEEAFWPWRYSPEISKELDQIARDNNVTINATGIQDACVLGLTKTITGACHKINSIKITTNANLDFYGPSVLSLYQIGATKSEYLEAAQEIPAEEQNPPIFGYPMEALLSDLGLTISDWDCRHDPILAQEPIESKSLGKIIDKNLVIGDSENLTIKTEESITITTQFDGKISPMEDPSNLSLEIKGEPDFHVVLENIDGEAITCANTVNRILDVIDAKPGLITCEKLAPVKITI